jgi:hypothetical protein
MLDTIIKQTQKGNGVFAVKKFKRGDIVVVGKAIEKISSRTNYSFQIDFNNYVNLDKLATTINHSCDPNTGIINNEYDGYNFVALKDINDNEEITWDYETTEYESIAIPHCLCNSLNCREKTLGFKFRELFLREKYGDFIGNYLKS